jgi:catechol 2,3-dioxygenase-like lactoylglutathione lyase family enzyme
MPVDAFQHINIRCADVEAAREFYVRVLGLRTGDRPPFTSSGYWLYLGSDAVVHLVQRPAGQEARSEPGALDHVAFRGVDLEATRHALREAAIPFQEAIVPRDGNVQIFVHDPDGLRIELNFAPLSG